MLRNRTARISTWRAAFSIFTLSVILGIVLFVLLRMVLSSSGMMAFGMDTIGSPADVAEQDKVRTSIIPSDTAIALPWYREHLDTDEKRELYDLIDAAICGRKARVKVPNLTCDETAECFWAVIYDHPEYFWVGKTYTYYRVFDDADVVYEFEMNYYMTDKDEIEAKLRDYELVADAIIAGAPVPQTESSTLRQIYTWICYNTSYESNERDQDMSSVFDDRSSVCAGYVQALQFMSLRAGIPCVRVSGHSIDRDGIVSDGNHTWAAIAPGGRLKYYDVTWDDKVSNLDNEKFYGVDQEELEKTHVIASDAAPRVNAEQDDSEAVVTCAYNIATGEHLEMPKLRDFDMGTMFDSLRVGFMQAVDSEEKEAGGLSTFENFLHGFGGEVPNNILRNEACELAKSSKAIGEDNLPAVIQCAVAENVLSTLDQD